MIRIVFCIECDGWAEEDDRHKHHGHHKKHLTKAKHLKSKFLFHNEESNMETYRLSWSPGVCITQDVIQIIGGAENPIAKGLGNTATTVDFQFTTDSSVEWFIRSVNADGTQTLDSTHATFTATDQTPPPVLTAATNLTDTWVSHTP